MTSRLRCAPCATSRQRDSATHRFRLSCRRVVASSRPAGGGSRAAAFVLLFLLIGAPFVDAHIQGSRPVLQRGQRERIVGLDPGPLDIRVDLSLDGDPLRQSIAHVLDPPRGTFTLEHREDASVAGGRFTAEWRFERLVEYRDANVNGRFEPNTDTAIKAWRFQHYQWTRGEPQTVQVADVRGNSIVWEANLTSAPHIRLEVVIAGQDFTDEGAIVRPQDIAMYLDLTDMPPRGLGSLYALEATVKVQSSTRLSLYQSDNTSTALLADQPDRRALLLWGGEALLDGAEQRTDATLEDERVGDDGMRTAKLVLHLQTVDRSMSFVMVSGIEYLTENRRASAPAPLFIACAVAALALVLGRRGAL